MQARVVGVVTGLALLVLGGLSPLPTDWLAVALLGLSALFLERQAVGLGGQARFSPAAAVYLAAALLPGAGCMAAGALVLLETVTREPKRILEALAARFGLMTGILGALLGPLSGQPWLAYLLGPALYLGGTVWHERQVRGELSARERLSWFRARHQVRPLELGLAAAAPALAALYTQSPLLGLVLVPVLATMQLAAENVVLKSRAETTEQVIEALADARVSQQETARELAETRTQKQLLEGFSQQLAQNPGLEQASRSLVATVFELMPVTDVAVFLNLPGQPADRPEPFYYQVGAEHQARLQGALLTGLREPLVDEACQSRAWVVGETRHRTTPRLLEGNQAAVAFALGELGALYVGRTQVEPFSQDELRRLDWLSTKARLAFEVAFRDYEVSRQQELQRQAVEELERRVVLLGSLTHGAEEMAATLDLEDLGERLARLLAKAIAHDHGMLVFEWEPGQVVRRTWGGLELEQHELLESARESGRPLLLDDLDKTRFEVPSTRSLLVSPLVAHSRTCGAILLGSQRPNAFEREQVDMLFLLGCQAGMAFSNARLYHEVVLARRQLEESQAQLIQSSKMTAVGQLAAGVAHELNTPLGAIALALEAAASRVQERPDSALRMIGKAQEGVERSRTIIERLLVYSRKPSHELFPVEVDKMVKDTLEFVGSQVKTMGAEVDFQPGCQHQVRGRWQELQQVLVNLLLNGIQAMEDKPPGEKKIKVRTYDDDHHAVIEVSDQGVGMTPDQLARAFEPFYTTKPVGKGTGLGLWVAHQIVGEHGGTLEAQSRPHHGSVFTVRLPQA